MVERWWESPFRVFQTNIREIDAGMDVERTLDHITGLGANVWLLNTAGIVSFFPSLLPYQHPSPWLSERASGDLVGDAIEQAHARGVRVISRVDLSKVHRDVAEAHPEWCFVGPGGESQIYNGLYSTCPSAPYYQERSVDILGEVLDNYEPDAFFFNMFKFKQTDYSGVYHGICHCGACTTRFKNRYGLDLPGEHDFADKAYLAWLEYTRETINEVSSTIRDYVSSRRPGCAVLLKEISDVTFREANNAVDRPSPIWVNWAGELVQDVLGTNPDKPVVVNSVMFLDIPYRFMAEQPGFVALHLIQTMAHGGNPMAYMIGEPELFTPATFDQVRDIFHFHRDHEVVYAGMRSSARVALLSSQTRDEFYGEATRADRAQKERRGIHRALLEAHVPFDIISDACLTVPTAELLGRFDVIIVPDSPTLGEEQCGALDAYVAAGGGLVTTYDTATSRPDGSPGSDIGLLSVGADSVIARHQGADALRASYVRPAEGQDVFVFANNKFIAVDRAFNVVDLKPGAQAPMTFLPASVYGPPEKCYWEIETDHPGVVTNDYGDGRTAYIPWPIGTLFYDLSLPEYREIIERAIEHVSRTPRQVTTNAPAQVEVVVHRQPETGATLVHLINYSGHDGRAFHDPIEIHDITLTLRLAQPVSAARSSRLECELAVSEDAAGSVTVVLPRLNSFDLITVS
jgi:hypothetical protein